MESKDIEPEDLILLEKDLERSELVSILFLLYGFEKPDWILDQLKKQGKANFLYDYATHHSSWKTAILQSLSITGAFEMIRNLGIEGEEALEDLKRNPVINPGLRLLFELCEACNSKTTEKLVNKIKRKCKTAETTQETLLEFFLLHSFSSRLVVLSKSIDDCDFSFISDHFAMNPCKDVQDVLDKFPSKANLDNSTVSSFKGLDLTSNIPSGPEAYQSQRMYVLIINQEHFYGESDPQLASRVPNEPLQERKGTDKDADALQMLFESFRYQVKMKHNQTHVDILKEVNQAAKEASKVDGLIVCVMSHGQQGVVYGSNSIDVEVKEIKKLMATKLLLEKPKILFVQACQGNNLQRTVKASKIEYDGPRISMASGQLSADFLTFWSTIEGFGSVRHVDDGTWFIQELVKKIRELHSHQHLMDICTAVIRDVSNKRDHKDQCMLPKLEGTFKRNFKFPQAIVDSRC